MPSPGWCFFRLIFVCLFVYSSGTFGICVVGSVVFLAYIYIFFFFPELLDLELSMCFWEVC